jgi:cytochrome c
VASYTDKGGKEVGPLTGTDVISIRSADVNPVDADEYGGFPRFGDNLSSGKHKGYILLKNIDLDNVKGFEYSYSAKQDGYIELRLDSRAGPVIVKTPFDEADDNKTLTADLEKPVSGRHDVYFFVLKKEHPDNGGFINLKKISFR